MLPATETIAILAFIAFSIPVISSLWRIFSMRQMLEEKITKNAHRLDLLESQIDHLVDKYTLAMNGQRELVNHVRDRSRTQEEKLSARLTDVERYLEKETSFVTRPASPNSGIFPNG